MHPFTSSSLLDLLADQVNLQTKYIPFVSLCTRNIQTNRPNFNYRPSFKRWSKKKLKKVIINLEKKQSSSHTKENTKIFFLKRMQQT